MEMMVISRGGRVSARRAVKTRLRPRSSARREALMSSIDIGTYVAPLFPPGQREIVVSVMIFDIKSTVNVLSLREFRGSGEANRAK